MPANHYILERRHLKENLQILECARKTEAGEAIGAHIDDRHAIELDRSRGGSVKTADDIEECRFAGTVRADDGEHAPFLDIETDVFQGMNAAKSYADIADLQDAHWRLLSKSLARLGIIPAGSSTMNNTIIKPSRAVS